MSTGQGTVDLVGNPPKAKRRFYEVVILLLVLNQAYGHSKANTKLDDIYFGGDQEARDLFFAFVCRLSQICDSRPKGSTVTAFSVLALPNGIKYVFASNARSLVELGTVKGYISCILQSLGRVPEINGGELRAEFHESLLREILIFNRHRIGTYLNGMAAALEKCLGILSEEDDARVSPCQAEFRQLLSLGNLARDKNCDDDDYNAGTQVLIEEIKQFLESDLALTMMKRASEDQSANAEPWRELRHCASRLVSYRRAVETLWRAAILFPELTRDFEVIPIPSSKKQGEPLNHDPKTASEILSHAVPGEEKERYVRLAEGLQHTYDLDGNIREEWKSDKFKPIIHAEILVLNWIENEYGTRPDRFFKNWVYIGCSKPTCRLCDYYVLAYGNGVRVRKSYGNLYLNWRMPERPDVDDCQDGGSAVKKRQAMFQALTSLSLQEVCRALRERVANTRRQDSATFSSLVTFTARIGDGGFDTTSGHQDDTLRIEHRDSQGLEEDNNRDQMED